jgi:hypothetical protein
MKKLIFACLIVILGSVLGAQTDPQWLWASRAGGAGNDIGYSISRDNAGNLYCTGIFLDVAQFGDTHLATAGNNDIFVAKLDPSGNWLWAVRAGGTGDDRGMVVSADGDGNSYIIGYFNGSADFGSTTLTSAGLADMFIAKLDPSGNWLWVKHAGGLGDDVGQTVIIKEGYCYLTGYFSGTASFGAISLSSVGSGDIFVARLDTNGNWLWAKRAGGTGHDEGDSVSIDGSGNCYMSGYFHNSATFGSHSLTGSGWDVFVTKLDPEGNCLWASSAGGSGTEGGWSLCADANGNCIVTGPFSHSATFGNTTLHCLGSQDIYIARLDNEGNWLWARRAGGSYVMSENTDVGCNVILDDSGNCCVAGYYYGEDADFGALVLPNGGYYNLFIAWLDVSGNWLWAITCNGFSNDSCWSVCLDGEGNTYATGAFSFSMNFGDTQLTSAGERDVWVGKLSPVVPVDDDLTPGLEGVSCLYNAYPNPFRQSETALIKAHVAHGESGTLTLYNLRGQIIQSQQLSSGPHEITINGTGLPAGVYLYQLSTPTLNTTRKLVLLK